MEERSVRVRAVALVIHENRVLIVQHRVPDETWWCFPGGEQCPGETQDEALVRELEEELGLVVHPEQLVYVAEFFGNREQALELYWLCHCEDTDLRLCEDTVADAHWVPVADLSRWNVLPALVADLITQHNGKLPSHCQYLGVHGP